MSEHALYQHSLEINRCHYKERLHTVGARCSSQIVDIHIGYSSCPHLSQPIKDRMVKQAEKNTQLALQIKQFFVIVRKIQFH